MIFAVMMVGVLVGLIVRNDWNCLCIPVSKKSMSISEVRAFEIDGGRYGSVLLGDLRKTMVVVAVVVPASG